MSAVKIAVYTDIICPWCLIGQTRLDQVIAKSFAHQSIEILHYPVMLLPDCPPLGMSIADLMRAKGLDPGEVQIRPQMEARAAGLALDLSRQPLFYPTVGAHTLIRLTSIPGKQHELTLALSTAYFIDALNIGDPDILADIGSRHGWNRAAALEAVRNSSEIEATRQEAARSAARGVRSVPHYFIDEISLSGHQSEETFFKAIARAAH